MSGQERLPGPGLGGGVVMVEAGLEAAGGELPAAAAVPASSTSGQPYTHQGILIQYTHTLKHVTLIQYTHTVYSHTHTIHSCMSHSYNTLMHSCTHACHTHILKHVSLIHSCSHTHTLRQSHSYTGLMQ